MTSRKIVCAYLSNQALIVFGEGDVGGRDAVALVVGADLHPTILPDL